MYSPRYFVDVTCFNSLLLSDKHKLFPLTLCRVPINIQTDLAMFNKATLKYSMLPFKIVAIPLPVKVSPLTENVHLRGSKLLLCIFRHMAFPCNTIIN